MANACRDFVCPYGGTLAEIIDKTPKDRISKVLLEEKVLYWLLHAGGEKYHVICMICVTILTFARLFSYSVALLPNFYLPFLTFFSPFFLGVLCCVLSIGVSSSKHGTITAQYLWEMVSFENRFVCFVCIVILFVSAMLSLFRRWWLVAHTFFFLFLCIFSRFLTPIV